MVEETPPPTEMSFGSHLEELRRRLTFGLIGILPIFIATLVFGDNLLEIVLRPAQAALRGADLPPVLIATSALETLAAWLKVSGAVTLVLGVPILLYQLWLFVAPGLYDHEKRFAKLLVPLSVLLTALGLLFLYFVMLPAMLAFLIGFGTAVGRPSTPTVDLPPGVVLPIVPILEGDPRDPPPGSMWINRPLEELRFNAAPAAPATAPQTPTPDANPAPTPAPTTETPATTTPAPKPPTTDIRGTPLYRTAGITPQLKISEYTSLVFIMALAFAAGFQTPVVVLLLGWIGLVDAKLLSRSRRYAVFGAFIVAAILTPSPDPFNMTLLAVPLYLLYELGILLLRLLPPSRVAKGMTWQSLRDRATGNPPKESDGSVDD